MLVTKPTAYSRTSYGVLDELLETVAIEVIVDVHAKRVRARVHGTAAIFADHGPGCPKGLPLVIREVCRRLQGSIVFIDQFVVGLVDLILVKLIVFFLVVVLVFEVEKVAIDTVVLVGGRLARSSPSLP